MDGSIADLTRLRIRNQLQNTYVPDKGKFEQGAFQQLLDFHAAPFPSSKETRPADADDAPPADSSLAATGQPPATPTKSAADDSGDEDEPVSADEASDGTAVAWPVLAQLPTPTVDTSSAEQTTSSESVNEDQLSALAAQGADNPASVEPSAKLPKSRAIKTGEAEASAAEVAVDAEVLPTDESQQPQAPVIDANTAAEPVKAKEPSLNEGDQTAKQVIDPQIGSQSAGAVQAAVTKPVPETSEPVEAIENGLKRAPAKPKRDSVPDTRAQTPEAAPHGKSDDATQPVDNKSTSRPGRRDGIERRDKWFLGNDTKSVDEDHGGKSELERTNESVASDREVVLPEAIAPASAAVPSDANNITSALPSADVTALANAAAASMQVAPVVSAASNETESRSEGLARSAPSATAPSMSSVVRGTGNTSATANSVSGAVSGTDSGQKDAQPLSQQERVRLVQRVARSFSRLGADGGQITLKLHPPQLGVLNVSVRIEGQTMSAKLQTESASARDAILENLPVLRERLAEQGIDVARFQVDVGDAHDFFAGGQSQGSFGGERSGEQRTNHADIDYRRVSRSSSATRDIRSAMASRLAESSSWQPRAHADRTLDVRA